jgi:hypothetical protein
MRLKTQRKVIYTTMALTVLALVGGYAAAALTAAGTTSHQNGFTFSAPADTIYGGTTPTANLVVASAGTCTPNGNTVTASSGATSANAYISGQGACVPSTDDFFEDYTFTSNAVGSATSPSDTFSISCTGFANEAVTIAYSGLTGTDTVTTNIYYEVGGSAPSVSCIIAVTGS